MRVGVQLLGRRPLLNGITSTFQTLIERWDGTSWAIVTSPNTSTAQNNVLFGVTCESASECWAVGSYYNGGTGQTLIERWDGTSWAIVISPNTSTTQNNSLNSVTCVASNDCWAVGSYLVGQTLTERYTASPPIPTSVVSRKTHGTAGDFDIDLPLAGNPGIECRSGGANADYQVVLTFPSAVTFTSASATPASGGTGSVASTGSSADGTQITVNLTGVSNAQTLTINLLGVSDGSNTDDVHISMSILLGDTTGDKFVNSGDSLQTRNRSGQVTDATNFRSDVNVDGTVNSGDSFIVRSKSGTALP